MLKVEKFGIGLVIGIWSLVILTGGCAQQVATTGAVDYTKATTDCKTITNGLQSSTGNTSKTSSGTGGNVKSSGIITQDVTPEGSYWQTWGYTYVWTTEAGTTIVETGTTSQRYLDANNNALLANNAFSVEVSVLPGGGITYEVKILAKKVQVHSHSSSSKSQSVLSMVMNLPTTYSFPMTFGFTGTGEVTYTTAPVSTFEVTNLTMTVTVDATYKSTGIGSLSWRYRAPSGMSYVGSLGFTQMGTDPTTVTGYVYQDLNDNGAGDSDEKVGTISIAGKKITITLDNGMIIYAGNFD